jgi:iron complex outermembrane receptor protein
VSAWQLAETYKTNPGYFRLGTGTNQTGVQAETFRRQNSERITERVTAGYAQLEGQLFNNKLGFVVGARYEKTNDKGVGLLNDPDAVFQRNADGTFVRDGGGARVRKAEAGTANSMEQLNLTHTERGFKANRSYDSVNPSVHLTYNLTNDLLVRFAYASTFGRPDYANIIPATTVDENEAADIDPTLSPGSLTIRNTGLRPWTADNFDLSLEYYFKEGGLVSAGAFVKNLEDFWGTRSGTVDAALADELGIGSEYIGWSVSTTINSGDAKIEGVEVNFIRPLTFLPGWGKFFTIKANGTQLRLSGPRATDFRGFIEETGNFNIGFNKKPFSANLTFNYRGRQKNAPQTGGQYGAATGFYEYYAPRTFVDVSGEVKLTKNMALFAGVRNLFNKRQVLQRYNDVTPGYAKGFRYEEFGIAMSVGIKGSF